MNTTQSQTLRADAFRYTGSLGRREFWSTFWNEPGFRFTFFLRKVAFLASRKRSLAIVPYVFYRLCLSRYRFRYGYDISPLTTIGPGLYIGHFGTLVVSPCAVLGTNVNLSNGAVIGATSRGANKGAPTLGDRVWVGSHAIIVGKITIGDDALIAPGAYVNFDVPPNSVVLGNPGRVVSQKGSAGYVNNLLPGTAGQSPLSVK